MLFLLFIFPLFFSCPIPHCKSCSSDNEFCEECDPGFLYQRDDQACIYFQPCPVGTYKTNNVTALCQECDASCEYCWGPSNFQCYFCSKGFFFESLFTNTNNQKCVTCPSSNCQECDNEGVCEKCRPGFYLNQNKECQKCGEESCERCPNDQCDKCKTGYIRDQNQCEVNSTCLIGAFFDQTEQKCKACAPECVLCFGSSDSQCFECKEGFYFDLSNKCIRCNASCKGCDDDANYCISCPQGKVLRGHDCVDKCQDDEYFDNIDSKCKECDGKCGKCIDKRDKCTQCFDEVFYNFNSQMNSCDQQCPDGQYPKLNSYSEDSFYLDTFFNEFWDLNNLTNIDIKRNFTCALCSPMCKTCYIRENVCTSCPSNQFLLFYNCVPKCPKGYFGTIDIQKKIGICKECRYPCADCNDLNTCVECYSPFNLENKTCVYKEEKVGKCEDWEFRLGVICRDQCPKGTDPVGDVCLCDSSCASCTIYLSSNIIACEKCKILNYYSYKGICYEKCPNATWSYHPIYLLDGTTNFCYDQCPTSLLKLVQNNQLQCVKYCPPLFTQYQGYCLLKGCPEGYFLNATKLLENSLNASNFNEVALSLICDKCDASCQTCVGPNETQCLVCANDFNLEPSTSLNSQMIINLYNVLNSTAIITNIQEKILEIYKTNGTICSKECSKGFIKVNKICMLCIKNCEVCDENLYLLNNNCYAECPRLTEKDDVNDECVSSFDFSIEIPSINNYVGYGKDLPVRLKLELFQNNVVNMIKCNLADGQLNKDVSIPFSETLRIFDFKIDSGLLQKNSSYSLECTVSSSFIAKQKKIEFKTFDLSEGVFQISPQIGYSLLDSIVIKFEKWMVTGESGVSVSSLPLNYNINLIDSEGVLNEELFSGQDPINQLGLIEPFSKMIVKKLSKSIFNSTLHISLEIANDNIKPYVVSRDFKLMNNYSITAGVFDVPLKQGVSLKDNFTISIKNFYQIQNVLGKQMTIDYPLSYKINTFDLESKENKTLFKISEVKDFSKMFNLRFPYVQKDKKIKLELLVFSDLYFYSSSVELEIFFFYKHVALSPYLELPEKTCGLLQSSIENRICYDNCPNPSISIDNICYCDASCLSCTIYEGIQCEICKKTSEYSYGGICYAKCPSNTWKSKNQEPNQNYCYEKCSDLSIITSNNEYFCTNSCPPGFELFNNYCFEKHCPSDDYSFSLKNILYKNVSSSASYIDNFCIKCHSTCKECDGVTELNCLVCKENLFFYRNKCYSTCPSLTIVDPMNPLLCQPTFFYEIRIEKAPYLSFINPLKGELYFYQAEVLTNSFNCLLMIGSETIYNISLIHSTFQETYLFTIPEYYLENDRNYMIKCIVQRQGLKIENYTEFHTSSLPQGTFSLSATSGYEIKDIVKIEISDWTIKEDLQKDNPFTYALYIINKEETNKNTSFFTEQEVYGKNLSKKLDFKLPHTVQNPALIILQLNVYNHLTFITKTLEIKVYPYLTKVALASDMIIIPKVCENFEYNVAGVCKSSCPSPSISFDHICYCPEYCSNCIFTQLGSIECENCRNPEESSFRGECLPSCPTSTWINPKDKFRSQFCSEKCDQVKFVSQNGFYCIDHCLYESKNNICFKKECPDGYFFTSKNIDSDSLPMVNFDFLSFFCEKCDSICKICFGTSANQCSVCLEGYYFYKGQCFFKCPDETIINFFNPITCLSSSNYKIILDHSFSQYVSFINDLEGIVSIVDEEANQASITCTLFLYSTYVNLPIDRKNKNRFKITKDKLKPSTSYKISCTMEFDSKNSESSIEFRTVSRPQGNFKIWPMSGSALKDLIKMSIYSWLIYEDFTHKLPLTHIVYSYSQPEGNKTIYNKTTYDNLIKNLEYPLPYVDYNQTIQYELQVYNEFAFASTIIEVKDFVFYKRVALSPLYNKSSPKNCQSDDFKIENQCLDECPSSSFAIDGICYCHQSCQKCSFFRDLGRIECGACKDASLHNYRGNCLPYCPSQTWLNRVNSLYSTCDDCDENCMECSGPAPDNCLSCRGEWLLFKNKCFDQCPANSIINPDDSKTCKEVIHLEINLNLVKKYASYLKDLEGSIVISQMVANINKISCTLFKNNVIIQEFSLAYSTLGTNFIIYNSLLLPATNYYLKCKTETDWGYLGNYQEFATFSEPSGYFDVNPKQIISQKQNITIQLKEFVLNEDTEKKLDFTYTIYLKDPCYNRLLPVFMEKGFISRSFEYALPVFEKDCNVDFQLTVANDYAISFRSLGVKVLKKEIMIEDIKNATNEVTKYASEYISKNYSNNLLNSSCDSKIDCSGNGDCKDTYLNDGIKCNCFVQYKGIFCQWKKEDFEKTYAKVDKQLKDLAILSQSNLMEAFNILNNLGNIVDIYNTSLYEKSIDLIEGLANNVKNPDHGKAMIKTLDKFVNILSFIKNDFDSDYLQNNITSKLNNVIESAINSISSTLKADPISIKFENINIKLQNFSDAFLDRIRLLSTEITNEVNIFKSNFFNLKSLISEQPKDLYLSTSILNSNVFAVAQSNDIVVADIIDIQIKKKKTNEKLNLKSDKDVLSVLFQIKNPITSQMSQIRRYECRYFDSDKKVWSNDEITTQCENLNTCTCFSKRISQLTIFKTLLNDSPIIPKGIDNKNIDKFSIILFYSSVFICMLIIILYYEKSKDKFESTNELDNTNIDIEMEIQSAKQNKDKDQKM